MNDPTIYHGRIVGRPAAPGDRWDLEVGALFLLVTLTGVLALVVAVVDIATGGIPVPLAGALLLALAATVTLALMEALR